MSISRWRATRKSRSSPNTAAGPLNDLGLLKMDFLGLKTLTIIEDALELIHAPRAGFRP